MLIPNTPTIFQLARFKGPLTSHFFLGFKPCGNKSGLAKPTSGTIPGGGGGPIPPIIGGGGGPPNPGGGGGGGGPPDPGIGGGGGPPKPGIGGGGGPPIPGRGGGGGAPPAPGIGGGGGGPPPPGNGGGGGITLPNRDGSSLPVLSGLLVRPCIKSNLASASDLAAIASSNCFLRLSISVVSICFGLSVKFTTQ